MEDLIILGILALMLLFAIVHTIRHFRGQGGCCGGSSIRPRRKKLPQVVDTKTFHVDGMHCQHCQRRVEEIVNDIPGAAGKVNLKQGRLTVSYAHPVPDALLRAKLENAGYQLRP